LKKQKDFIFGFHSIEEAIQSGKEIERVLFARKNDTENQKTLFQLVRDHDIPYQFVPFGAINKITRKNHQGVLAFLSPITYYPLNELVRRIYEGGNDPLLLYLDRVTDVRNFGAIARSAECMGFNGLIIPEKGAARVNADAVNTSAGALMNIPVARARSAKASISLLKENGIKCIALTEKADQLISEYKFDGPVAVILGNEETGISDTLLDMADNHLKIPMKGQTASLNVSVAASVVMYEILRQRLL